MGTLNFNSRFHIKVYAEEEEDTTTSFGLGEDQRDASPVLTVVFHVLQRYHADTYGGVHVTSHDSTHESNCPVLPPPPPPDQFGSTDPVVSDDVVSAMLGAVHIPFPLDNMYWGNPRRTDEGSAARLNGGRDGVVSKVSEFATRMVRSGSDTGRTRFRMRVTIEKRVTFTIPSRLREWITEHSAEIRRWGRQTQFRFGQEIYLERFLRETAAEAAVMRAAPATKASVEALEKFTYDDDDVVCSSDVMTCTICMEEVLSGTQLTRLPCSHVFHGSCIVRWLENGHTCPSVVSNCQLRFNLVDLERI
ncbi:43kDa postsynaptic protein [Parasponia andersonii]|uniref:43kDa postsynaptic protein n=1 Tax=Parasponia andersonii TaxID=3476 RepID=A0A2P5C8R3_PARAD|nr:43kDa postsynaptic protein [Parasponia andersonii]